MARRCELTGKRFLAGNNVSHAHNKSRRRFNPNIQDTSLYSDVLGESFRLRVATSTLRTVEHKGGLDIFLAGAKDVDLSLDAQRLKRRVVDAQAKREEAGAA